MFKHTLWFDWETRSPEDIKFGAARYAEGSAPLIGVCALDEGPVVRWAPVLGEPTPIEVREYLEAPEVQLAFHHVEFDRTQMVAWGMDDDFDLSPRRFFCTMTAARMAGLPGALEKLCEVLGIPATYAKKDGNALIRKFCIPKADGTFNAPQSFPVEWEKFCVYAEHDVIAMRECMRRIPQVFSGFERELFAHTMTMNDRGIRIDRGLVMQAMLQSDRLKKNYKKRGVALTGDAEFNVVSQKAVLSFLKSYGVELPDARSATLEAFLDSEQAELLPPSVRDVLSTRLKTNKASVAKFTSMSRSLNRDDRIRGTISFYGAARTGRDAGRRVQVQNLARPVLVNDKTLSMEEACDIVKCGHAEWLFEDPLQLISDTVRGAIVAPSGWRLAVADLSNIEGRCCPWLAGEEWKLKYFRDFDAKRIKFDNYVMAYAGSFNVKPETVTKEGRQIGKVQELASQFGGSVGAYITFATAFRLDIDALGKGIAANADPYLVDDCRGMYEWAKDKDLTYGLEKETWAGIMAGVKAWRKSHSKIEESWGTAAEAFAAAVEHPGMRFTAAYKTEVMSQNSWVFVQLPSGRLLVYPWVKVEPGMGRKPSISFDGTNQFTKQWGRVYTTGPRLIENFTQAMARDCLFWHIPEAESLGYRIVLRVHDEIVAEVPERSSLSGEHLAQLIGRPHAWCSELPMAAAGETMARYQK